MKILIASDLEGISGICVWDQTRDRTTLYYQEARRLLMGDTSAAVDGCLAAGATEVFVEDEHAGGFNIVPELMHPKAKYITGKSRLRMSQRSELYKDFDGVILLGHHAMAGTTDGILNHSMSSLRGNRYCFNGVKMGEIGLSALRFGHFDIPIIMVAGDEAACRETRDLLGDTVTTVSVKKGITVEYAVLLPPEEAHKRIRKGAENAVRNIGMCKPYKTDLPIVGHLSFPDKDKADATKPRRAKRIDDHTFEASFESQLDVYEF